MPQLSWDAEERHAVAICRNKSFPCQSRVLASLLNSLRRAMPHSTGVLIVDDDPATCSLLEDALKRRGYRASSRTDAEEALLLLEEDDYDVAVSDLNMQGMNGVEFCRRVRECRPDVPVIIMTGFGTADSAVDAMRAGASDFVLKPFDVDLLEAAINRVRTHRALREEISRLRTEVTSPNGSNGMIGRSRTMHALANLITRAAPSEASVMICGESGTGKELVARAIHDLGRRAAGPFVAINCGALPEPLLESELFGHMPGAFTDAKTEKKGLFVAAHNGTIFLDEIGEMPISIQVKLLRALQERRVRPIGSSTELGFNARIISATNRDIDTDVHEGRFRSDLFYRLNVVRVNVPALRARGNDVLRLAEHFLEDSEEAARRGILGFSREVLERLVIYPFPGNVRELQNIVEGAVAMTRTEKIDMCDLPEPIRNYSRPEGRLNIENIEELVSMDELEQRYMAHVIRTVGGNKTQAAGILKLDRKTLYRKLRRWRAEDSRASAGRV